MLLAIDVVAISRAQRGSVAAVVTRFFNTRCKRDTALVYAFPAPTVSARVSRVARNVATLQLYVAAVGINTGGKSRLSQYYVPSVALFTSRRFEKWLSWLRKRRHGQWNG